MKIEPDQEPKLGRPPLGEQKQKTRSLRMDDPRWEKFKRIGATDWLRQKIDDVEEAQEKHTNQ